MEWALLVEGCIYLLGGYSTQFRVGNFGQEFIHMITRGCVMVAEADMAEHTTTNDACKPQGLDDHFPASAPAPSPD